MLELSVRVQLLDISIVLFFRKGIGLKFYVLRLSDKFLDNGHHGDTIMSSVIRGLSLQKV